MLLIYAKKLSPRGLGRNRGILDTENQAEEPDAMLRYLELSARPHQPLHFELALSIFNPSSDPITAIWHVELPPGIRESDGRRAFSGRTVVPAHRKLEANHWFIAADSERAYIHEQITARAELSAPKRHFSDEFHASIVQIRVG